MSDLLNSVSALLLPYGFSSLSNEVLLKYMLYGDESLTFDTNKSYSRQPLNLFEPLTAFEKFQCLLSHALAPIFTSCLANHEALWLQEQCWVIPSVVGAPCSTWGTIHKRFQLSLSPYLTLTFKSPSPLLDHNVPESNLYLLFFYFPFPLRHF